MVPARREPKEHEYTAQAPHWSAAPYRGVERPGLWVAVVLTGQIKLVIMGDPDSGGGFRILGMGTPVYITNLPSGPRGDPFLPCPYCDKGCNAKIYPLDTSFHLDDCKYNDGSVDVDKVFKQHAREQQEQSAKLKATVDRERERRQKYDPSYVDHSRSRTASSGTGRTSRLMIAGALVVGLLAWRALSAYVASDRRAPSAEVVKQKTSQDALNAKAERKRDHDLWTQGQAYRKHLKETVPGVILPPNPPEPPK